MTAHVHISPKTLVRERKGEQVGEGRGQKELTLPHNDYAQLFIPSPGAGISLSLPPSFIPSLPLHPTTLHVPEMTR